MAAPRDERRLGLAWASGAAVGGALFVVPWKLANTGGDSAHSVLLLLVCAALANTALVAWQRMATGSLRLGIRPIDLWVAALLAIFTLFGNLASAYAIRELSPALLNVLLRAEVILVAVFAWLWLGERVEPRFWLGVGIAALGLVVLQRPFDAAVPGALLSPATGLALLAAACFSGLGVVVRQYIRRVEPVAVNALRLWLAVAFWFPFHPRPRLGEIPLEQAVYAALAALAGPFLGRLFLMNSARYLEARVSTLANLSTPVLTLLLALLLLGDWPQPHELAGGAIMIAGIALPLLQLARKQG